MQKKEKKRQKIFWSVDSDYRDGGGYVVYGSGDDDGGIWQR